MSDRGTADQDLFQIWLASSREFFAADDSGQSVPESLKQKCEDLFAAWNQFARVYAEAGSAGIEGGPFDPAGWLDVAGGGGLGDLWRVFGADEWADLWRGERDAFAASKQWIVYVAALERYRTVIGAAWLKAFGRFTKELARDSDPDGAPGGGIPGWDRIRTRWDRAAEAELAKAQRSEEFLAAQRDLIRARLDCSTLLRQRAERFAGILGLPTRAEIDDLHEAMHHLKRELRAMRARLADGR
jgi:hypothetical protein